MKVTYTVVFYTTTFTSEEPCDNRVFEARYPDCTPRQAAARCFMEFAATAPSHAEIRDETGVLVETVCAESDASQTCAGCRYWKRVSDEERELYERDCGQCSAPSPHAVEYPRYALTDADAGKGCPCWCTKGIVAKETAAVTSKVG